MHIPTVHGPHSVYAWTYDILWTDPEDGDLGRESVPEDQLGVDPGAPGAVTDAQ